MSAKFIIAIGVFLYTIVNFARKSKDINKRLNSYRSLDKFAKIARDNLNGEFDNISNIISSVFELSEECIIDHKLLNSIGFKDSEIDKIMEYTIMYNQLDIYSLRNAAAEFCDFTTELRQKSESEYKKNTASLLCLPICSLILIILII